MRRIVIVSALIVSVLGTGALVPSEAEAREPVVIDCRTLVGTGRGTRPLQIGTIRRLTVVANCPALSQGYGFNSRYFVFRLRRAATNESYVGAAWMPRPDAIAGVHPFLVTMQGVVIARSPTHGQSARYANGVDLRYIATHGLRRGAYVLGVELLDSPLRALQTPAFNLIIMP